MKFPYYKIPTTDLSRKWIGRPLVPITIFGPTGHVNVYALIDSGADRSLFNIQIAKDIGLNLDRSHIEHFSGIEGGKIPTFITHLELQVIGSSKTVDLIAGFTDSPNVGAILGQEGFFDEYKIVFHRKKKIIELF